MATYKRIHIESPGLTSATARVIDSETGEDIPRVREVHFHLKAHDVTRAEVYVYGATLNADVDAEIIEVSRLHVAQEEIAELKQRLYEMEMQLREALQDRMREELPD